jgi:MFS family permease
MAFLALPVLLGLHTLYPWTDHDVVAHDHLLEAKSPWLNPTFFYVRTAIYFTIWTVLARWFHKRSTEQDRSGDPRLTGRMETASTAGLILFAFTVTFFAFDFIMSLTPHWYSTIFGVYFFAGCVLGFFALLLVTAFALQSGGRLLQAVSTEHYHDLGKLIFAFTIFWAYIGFSQYMLMWYANLPEETVWYAARQTGSWTGVSVLVLFGHFFLPFLLLMSRHVKRRKALIAAGAVWMLLMQFLDVYWMVMPSKTPDGFTPSLMDLAAFVGVGGCFFAAAVRRLGAHALVAVRDPRLSEALEFENY